MRAKYGLLLLSLALSFTMLNAQSPGQQAMQDLSFLVGEWVGTSGSFENGEKISEVPAFESIQYDLDNHILVIQLNSETLQLHTIVNYHPADSTYYYHAFSKSGGGKLPAKLEAPGRLVVQANENKRYIFEALPAGGFREYGEKRSNGSWQKYFEDRFVNTQ